MLMVQRPHSENGSRATNQLRYFELSVPSAGFSSLEGVSALESSGLASSGFGSAGVTGSVLASGAAGGGTNFVRNHWLARKPSCLESSLGMASPSRRRP